MLQDILLEHCYPTLSNLKFANMINVDYTDSIFEDIFKLNEKLSEYNFSLIILKQTRKKLLLYLINYNLIENYNDKRLQNALKSYGYPADNFNSSINFLKKRLLENEFPHEIGFFLGYPYEDVLGFINYNAGIIWYIPTVLTNFTKFIETHVCIDVIVVNVFQICKVLLEQH